MDLIKIAEEAFATGKQHPSAILIKSIFFDFKLFIVTNATYQVTLL